MEHCIYILTELFHIIVNRHIVQFMNYKNVYNTFIYI